MIDKILLRKVKFDVLDMLDLSDFAEKIYDFVLHKDDYSDNIDYPKDLLRKANLDISLNNIDDICEALTEYVESLNDVNAITHYSILDYLNELNLEISKGSKRVEEKTNTLKIFISIKEQLVALENKLLEASMQIIKIEDNGDIFDTSTNEKMFESRDYFNGREAQSFDQIFNWAVEFLSSFLIKNQKKLLSILDFDDDGYLITMTGDDIFTSEEKKVIVEKIEAWMKKLYPDNNQNTEIETINKNEKIEEDFYIDDDVSIIQTELTKESKERMSRLKDTLKASSNKIKK